MRKHIHQGFLDAFPRVVCAGAHRLTAGCKRCARRPGIPQIRVSLYKTHSAVVLRRKVPKELRPLDDGRANITPRMSNHYKLALGNHSLYGCRAAKEQESCKGGYHAASVIRGKAQITHCNCGRKPARFAK